MWIIYETIGKAKPKAIGAYGDEASFEAAWKNGNAKGLNISFEQIDPKVSEKKLAPPDYRAMFTDAVNDLKDAHERLMKLNLSEVASHVGESDYKSLARIAIDIMSDDECIIKVAKPYQMYVDIGEYGYGRSIEWNSSDGEISGTWMSSSASC